MLVEALTDPDPEVRTAAAVALGKWRAVVAIPEPAYLTRPKPPASHGK
jgi:HEAT repeat protein